MRHLYLAATGINRGKTTFALGLVAALLERGHSTGFIKPVGQHYALVDGVPADEDAILVRTVFGLDRPLTEMSPVHIPRGFTRAFIQGEVTADLPARILAAHAAAARHHELLLIEGTGHAGVGAVIGLSNAEVAALLGAPAIIISEAGVGRPIDEIVLNQALFAQHGVRVAGAIINKVDSEAHPSLPEVLRRGLARHGIELLGALPYRPILSHPTLPRVVEQMSGELLAMGDDPARAIERVAICDMQPRHVLARIKPGSLLLFPGDRDDIIRATLEAHHRHPPRHAMGLSRSLPGPGGGRHDDEPDPCLLAGLLLTGGYRPREPELEAIRRSGLFAYLVSEETYVAASRVRDLLVKTHAADTEKVAEIKRLIADDLDVDRVLAAFAAPPSAASGRRARSRPLPGDNGVRCGGELGGTRTKVPGVD